MVFIYTKGVDANAEGGERMEAEEQGGGGGAGRLDEEGESIASKEG